MTVSDKDGEIASWKISSARGGYPTPTGTFTPHYTSRMHYSKASFLADALLGVLQRGRGGAWDGRPGQSRRPASHGCVRSHPKNAKVFYDLVQKHGMQLPRVTVRGKPPYSPVVAEGRRRRVAQAQPAFQGFSMFGYSQPYQPKRRNSRRSSTAAATATLGSLPAFGRT